MPIERVKPIITKLPPVQTPQCCVVAEETKSQRDSGWRKRRYTELRPNFDPLRCQRESVVVIDGKYYCRPHAGMLALKWWLEGKLVQKVEEQTHQGDLLYRSPPEVESLKAWIENVKNETA